MHADAGLTPQALIPEPYPLSETLIAFNRPWLAGFAAFEDLFAHILRRCLDFLHLFADPRARGLIPTLCLAHILNGFFYKPLQGFVFLHERPPEKGSY